MTQTWATQTPATSPGQRLGGAMAYFPGLGVVLVGGTVDSSNGIRDSADTAHAATWVWNGITWTKLAPATEAPAGWGCALAYDSDRNVLVYVPGYDAAAGGPLTGLYAEFNGTTWTVHSGTGVGQYAPPEGQSIAYDKHRQVMVYYSPDSTFRRYNTFELNATSHTWTAVISAVTPPYNDDGYMLVYDEVRELIYAVGPDSGGTQTFTFSYNGTAWTQVATTPPSDFAAQGTQWLSFVWDPITEMSVLKTSDRTFSFDGTTWTRLTLTSEGYGTAGLRPYAMMAYDISHHSAVLFGGQNPSLNATTFVLVDPVVVAFIGGYATTTNTVRVLLSREPQHTNGFIPGDALNPQTWTVIDDNGISYTPISVVEINATTFDVMLLQSLGDQWTTHTISSSTLRSLATGDPVSSPISEEFLGVVAENDPLRSSTINTYRDRDLLNPPFNTGGFSGALVIGADNDFENEDGAELTRKLIFRRLGTVKGAFKHLPNYGIGIVEKEPLPGGGLLKLKTEMQAQILQEPDVSSCSLALMIDRDGVLSVSISVVLKSTGSTINIAAAVQNQTLVEL